MITSVYLHVSSFARSLLQTLIRVRFTLLMVLLLTGIAVWSDSHIGPLHPDIREAFGFAPQHLPALHWYRPFTSVFLTSGGWIFYQALAMLAGSVAWCEWIVGTRKAVHVFWGIHLVTLAAILTPIALAAASLGAGWAQSIVRAADVGPSAGYYGCLGVAIAHLSVGRRRLLAAALVTILAVRFSLSVATVPDQGHQIVADLAHLIAFPMGLLAGLRLIGLEKRIQPLSSG